VNNAGITRNRSSRKPADGEWVDVINVNLNGTFYCTSAAIDRMVSQKHGHIINIFSMQGQTAASAPASQKGLIAFTRTVALETAKYGITANAVSPGYTATEMFDALPENLKNQIQAKIPAGRFCKPEEVACAVAFLASEADYITGQQISVSGGVCM
jgi:NAD(P)-dependent dehydrogenase (short-subunit alcohol dehydrogenase family)